MSEARGDNTRGSGALGNRARGALGKYGEELAARRLAEAGMTVLERNWRCGRTGEIDIAPNNFVHAIRKLDVSFTPERKAA